MKSMSSWHAPQSSPGRAFSVLILSNACCARLANRSVSVRYQHNLVRATVASDARAPSSPIALAAIARVVQSSDVNDLARIARGVVGSSSTLMRAHAA